MTYSFPCQDLSVAGSMRGMSKGSGTRSGLLWEVERILDECGTELPQVLLMENVPNVIGKGNIKDFQAWRAKLESLGYQNYLELLNAKDYGIPQNRNRCFMVSLLGNYSYTFPKKQELTLRLKDMLDKDVEEKYFLSKKCVEYVTDPERLKKMFTQINGDVALALMAGGITNCTGTFIDENLFNVYGYTDGNYGGNVYDSDVLSPTIINFDSGGNRKPIIIDSRYIGIEGVPRVYENVAPVVEARDYKTPLQVCENSMIRKLTPRECWRLMGFTDEDFAKAEKVNSNTQLYKQAGNSIVVNVLMSIFAEMLPNTNCYRQLANGMNDAFDICVDDFCSKAERKEK